MKIVTDNQGVACAWVAQRQPKARNGQRSFWFEGLLLYSYRTPIGHLYQRDGRLLALLDSANYSITTESKHVNAAVSALIRDNVPFLRVPLLPGVAAPAGRWAHTINTRYLDDRYAWELARLKSKRRRPAESDRDWLARRMADRVRYREWFNLPPLPAADPAATAVDHYRVALVGLLVRHT